MNNRDRVIQSRQHGVFVSALISMFNAVTTIINVMLSIPTFFSEDIPEFFADASKLGVQKTSATMFDASNGIAQRMGAGLGLGLVGLSYAIFNLLFLLGRLITSPNKSAKAAYQFGLWLANNHRRGKYLAALFAALSIMLSMLAYAALLPILGAYLAKVLTPIVPTWLSEAIDLFMLTHAAVLDTIAKAVATVFMPVITPILHTLGLVVSTAIIGLAALKAVAATVIGAGASFVTTKFNAWMGNEEVVDEEPDAEETQQAVNAPTQAAAPAPQPTVVNGRTVNFSEMTSQTNTSANLFQRAPARSEPVNRRERRYGLVP